MIPLSAKAPFIQSRAPEMRSLQEGSKKTGIRAWPAPQNAWPRQQSRRPSRRRGACRICPLKPTARPRAFSGAPEAATESALTIERGSAGQRAVADQHAGSDRLAAA